jgi:hypothetical protein
VRLRSQEETKCYPVRYSIDQFSTNPNVKFKHAPKDWTMRYKVRRGHETIDYPTLTDAHIHLGMAYISVGVSYRVLILTYIPGLFFLEVSDIIRSLMMR